MPHVSLEATNPDAEITSSAGHQGRSYIAPIDSLRAIAVLAVMIYHIQNNWLRGGFSGVDVFLVVSGYVISRSMLELDHRGLLAFAASFYARRARRILPALLVCLLLASLLTALFVPHSWLSSRGFGTAQYAVWGLSNYFLGYSGDRYFDPQADFNPFVHTWSLGLEEQFYWLYPFIFYVWLRRRTSRAAAGPIGPALLLVLLAASCWYSAYATVNSPTTAYYSLPSRFWELACGAQLFQMHASGWDLDAAPNRQLTAGLGIIAVGFVFSTEAAFPIPWALTATLGTALVINAVTRPNVSGFVFRCLNSTVLVWIGKRSFSLYLWHWILYVLFRWTVGLDSWAEAITVLVLIVALSAASYRWIENPFRRGFRTIAPRAVIAWGLACMAVTWTAIKLIDRYQYRISLSVTRDLKTWYPIEWESANKESSTGCGPVRTSTSFAGGILLLSSRPRCERSTRTLFIAGDSHALAYATMFARLVEEQPIDVRLYYRTGCPFLKLDKPLTSAGDACEKFFTSVIEDIRSRANDGDLLFLPSLRIRRFGDQWGSTPATTQGRAGGGSEDQRLRGAATAEASTLLRSLTGHGLRVVLEAPKPIFRAPPFRCSDWFNRTNPVCAAGFTMSRAALLAYREPVMAQLRELALVPGVSIWDPFDAFCPDAVCDAVPGGIPLFFDGDHPSGAGNEQVYGSFTAHLSTALPATDHDRPTTTHHISTHG